MTTESGLLSRLERWYLAHCNGAWEHGEGVRIETLDNPGWRVEISIVDTPLQSRPFDRVETDRSDEDWIRACTEDGAWKAAGGPLNLSEMLTIFLAWADA